MPVYVKKKDKEVWHWCKNCSNYPKGKDLDSRKTKPPANKGKLCTQCAAKAAKKGCKA